MTKEENIMKAIGTLGEVIQQKEFEIELRDFRVKQLEGQVKELQDQIKAEPANSEQYEFKIKRQNEYISDLEARIYDLEERIAIMTESEAPSPVWDITPAPAAKKEGE